MTKLEEQTLKELETQYSEAIELSMQDVLRQQGAVRALQVVQSNLMGITKAIDGELESGVISGVPKDDDGVHKYSKLWAARCVQSVANQLKTEETNRHRAEGAVSGIAKMQQVVSKKRNLLEAKAARLSEAIDEGDVKTTKTGAKEFTGSDLKKRPAGSRPARKKAAPKTKSPAKKMTKAKGKKSAKNS